MSASLTLSATTVATLKGFAATAIDLAVATPGVTVDDLTTDQGARRAVAYIDTLAEQTGSTAVRDAYAELLADPLSVMLAVAAVQARALILTGREL